MKTAATVLFLLAITPVAAHAGQVKTPTISTPHVNVKTSVSTPNNQFGTGGGAGKVNTNDFHFTKNSDSASPNLFGGSGSSKGSGAGGGTGKVNANDFHFTKNSDSASPVLFYGSGNPKGSGAGGGTGK